MRASVTQVLHGGLGISLNSSLHRRHDLKVSERPCVQAASVQAKPVKCCAGVCVCCVGLYQCSCILCCPALGTQALGGLTSSPTSSQRKCMLGSCASVLFYSSNVNATEIVMRQSDQACLRAYRCCCSWASICKTSLSLLLALLNAAFAPSSASYASQWYKLQGRHSTNLFIRQVDSCRHRWLLLFFLDPQS